MAGTSFSDLIAPVTKADFLAEFFGKKSSFIKGQPKKFDHLFSLERFFKALEVAETKKDASPDRVRAFFKDKKGREGMPEPHLSIAPRQARAAYAAGATVCVTGLHECDPGLADLCLKIKTELGYVGPVSFNAYWSPDGVGFGGHWDARIATTLQIAGTKKWRYSRVSAVEWPNVNATFTEKGVAYDDRKPKAAWETTVRPLPQSEWEEALLEPGDFLCLPAGTWHEAAAEGMSFALNLAFNRVDPAYLLGLFLQNRLESSVAWRHIPPLFESTHGGPSPEALSFLRAGFDDLGAALMKLRDNPAEFIEWWATSLELRSDGAPQPEVKDNVTYGLSPTALITSPLGSGPVDALHAVVEGTPIKFEGPAARIVADAARGKSFVPAADTSKLVKELVAKRVLVPQPFDPEAELNIADVGAAFARFGAI
jgi:ribosomal protein L16 Arg81 hydroxylase